MPQSNIEQEVDLFEHIDTLPQEVQDVLARHQDDDNDYLSCANLVKDLEAVGYTCDYYLDAEPYNLRKINLEVTN
jgi:hypothetical protein